MFNFEDGQLIENAYVEINGVKYPVTMPKYSGNTPLTAETFNLMQKELLKVENPVGHIRMETTNVNPATYLGFGTWTLWGQGRVPVGVDATDSDFNSAEKTGGEKTHKLTTAEMPKHKPNVGIYINNNVSGGDVYWFEPKGFASGNTGSSNSTKVSEVGGDQAHNNLQPYITCYMWKRTA